MHSKSSVPAGAALALAMLAGTPAAAQNATGTGLDTLAKRMLEHVDDLGRGGLWMTIEHGPVGSTGRSVPAGGTLAEEAFELVADTVRAMTAGGPLIDFDNLGRTSEAGRQLESALSRLTAVAGAPGAAGISTPGERNALADASIERMLSTIDHWDRDPTRRRRSGSSAGWSATTSARCAAPLCPTTSSHPNSPGPAGNGRRRWRRTR